ncbi:MAG: efflux transporter outer membrane subunit [Phycisphaerae bacterium]|nr:efflux transporter outer membrane subunit [Phycisphaerae bacterium]
MMRRWICVSLIYMTALSGCSVGPDYRRPEVPTPEVWSGEKDGPVATQPSIVTTQPADVSSWWKTLKDPTLDSLIERAIESNLDLRIATARIREARAQRGIIAADLWPEVNASGSYHYRGSSLNTTPKTTGGAGLGKQFRNSAINSGVGRVVSGPTAIPGPGDIAGQALTGAVSQTLQNNASPKVSRGQNLFQAGFDASWEIDVFGGIRREIEAADADIAVSIESRRDVQVTLLSEVGLNYVQLRSAQRRLEIARENIRVQRDTVELTQTKYEAGFTSELDVVQAQAQLASTESQVPLFETAIKQAIYQLSVLLAFPPATLLEELEQVKPIPTLPPEVPIGLPSELLRRRPDIRIAENQLAAATARIGAATADLFPRFSLTGSIGPQSRTINHLFDRNSVGWSIGPSVSWPVFDGWRIRSNIEVQNARQEQALAIYEQTVLVAFQDVESSLTAYINEQSRHRSLARAVEASERSTNLSNELYQRGMTAFLNVLESQRALYTTQDQLIQSEASVVTNLISLYKALGGGWEVMEE